MQDMNLFGWLIAFLKEIIYDFTHSEILCKWTKGE